MRRRSQALIMELCVRWPGSSGGATGISLEGNVFCNQAGSDEHIDTNSVTTRPLLHHHWPLRPACPRSFAVASGVAIFSAARQFATLIPDTLSVSLGSA